MSRMASDEEAEKHISQEYEAYIGREYEAYINRLLGECGHQQPTDPIATCDINGKPCLLEENLPCAYLQEVKP